MAGRSAHPWFYGAKNAWYVNLDGRKVSLGVKGEENKADAVKAWHKLIASEKPTPQAKAEAVSAGEVLTAFLADSESRVQPITLSFYRRFLLPFAECHGKLRADALTTTFAEAYSRKPTWSSSTRHDCLGTLATAFKWAERSRLILRSPLTGLRLPPKESRGAEAVISEADYGKLLSATTSDFRALLRLLWLTGCRPNEATGLTVEAVD
jgi:integrase